MPCNLQFSLFISVFQTEGAYMNFLWISPEVVGSVVFSQACECVTKSIFLLLKGLFLQVWKCTGHRRTGNSLCWDELALPSTMYIVG